MLKKLRMMVVAMAIGACGPPPDEAMPTREMPMETGFVAPAQATVARQRTYRFWMFQGTGQCLPGAVVGWTDFPVPYDGQWGIGPDGAYCTLKTERGSVDRECFPASWVGHGSFTCSWGNDGDEGWCRWKVTGDPISGDFDCLYPVIVTVL